MANTLTELIPTLFSANQTVAREITGFVAAVRTDFDDKAAALNQSIKVPIAPVQDGADYSPSNVTATGSDRVAGSTEVKITKNRMSTFHLTGEEERALVSGGNDNATELFRQSVEQAMRTLVNEVEGDLADIYKAASRAHGNPNAQSAHQTPFASDLKDALAMRKILIDNGAPNADLHIVMDTTAGVNLRNLGQISKANEAGTDRTLRSGALLDLHGMLLHESGQVKQHVAGIGADYLINKDPKIDAGETEITVDTGTGTILAGDVISIADAVGNYCVNTALASGKFKIGNPGLLVDALDNKAVTLSATYRANVALHRNAAVLVARPPAIDPTPIIETMMVSDQMSGLSFLVCRCLQDGQITYRVHLAWGYKVVQPEFVAVLQG